MCWGGGVEQEGCKGNKNRLKREATVKEIRLSQNLTPQLAKKIKLELLS